MKYSENSLGIFAGTTEMLNVTGLIEIENGKKGISNNY